MNSATAKGVGFDNLYGNDGNDDNYWNVTGYMKNADRTVSDQFYAEAVPTQLIKDAVKEVQLSGAHVDKLKRALFYGKTHEDIAFAASLAPAGSYEGVDPEIIHAILGIYTEAAELMELLGEMLADPTKDLSGRLKDESGDEMWYLALLFKKLGTDFEEVGDLNIEKLRKRFPVKFTEDLAVNRDEANEATTFQ